MMTLSLIPFFLSAALAIGMGVHAAGHIRVRGASSFAIMSFSSAAWIVLYILETISPDLEQKWLWDTLQWIPACSLTLAGLQFSLTIVRDTYRISIPLLMVASVIMLGLLLVNNTLPGNHPDRRLVEVPPLYALIYSFNVIDWIGVVFTYSLVALSWFVLVRQYLKSSNTYRKQLRLLIFGLSVAIVMSFVALVLDIRLLGQPDVTPFTFGLANLILARGLFRYQLFNLGSSARMIVVEGMSDAFIVTDHEGRIIDLNTTARHAARDKQDRLEGELAAEIFPQWIEQADLITNAESITREIPSEDGTFEVRSLTVRDRDERQVGRLITVRDITAAKQAQEQEVALRLERDRALLLANFIQSASHEFRTPLTSIGTSLYIMERATSPDQIVRHRKKAETEIQRISHLVDDLEIMAALDSELPLSREPHALAGVITEVIRDLTPTAASLNVGIDFADNGNALKANINADKVAHALSHLIRNALQHSHPGSLIHVRLGQDRTDAVIQVRDSGRGIAEEDLPHIFERFWRRDTAHSTPGFGLGLPIAQKITQMHGGSIVIESVPGTETCATIRLPIIDSAR